MGELEKCALDIECRAMLEAEARSAQRLMWKLSNAADVKVSGGAFHYQMRAGPYGPSTDEAGWKVDLGLVDMTERHGYETNPFACRFSPKVLMNNWVDERSDRNYVKYDNAPKLSQYGHLYKSEYSKAFTKPVCNRAREVLLKIDSFPINAHPGHQPELQVPVLRVALPNPVSCAWEKDNQKMRKELEVQKRYDRAGKEKTGESGAEQCGY